MGLEISVTLIKNNLLGVWFYCSFVLKAVILKAAVLYLVIFIIRISSRKKIVLNSSVKHNNKF